MTITPGDVARAERALEYALDLLDEHRPRWQHRAACHGLSHLFMRPTNGGDAAAARAICAACPVRAECRDYALTAGPWLRGVWAGLSGRDRRSLREDRASA